MAYRVSEAQANRTTTDTTCDVLYLPGKAAIHRLAGHRQWWWPLIFIGLLVALVINIAVVVAQAKADIAKGRKYG